MIVLGVPAEVKGFFARAVRDCSKPIRQTLASLVLAIPLAPTAVA